MALLNHRSVRGKARRAGFRERGRQSQPLAKTTREQGLSKLSALQPRNTPRDPDPTRLNDSRKPPCGFIADPFLSSPGRRCNNGSRARLLAAFAEALRDRKRTRRTWRP